jgi:hypothetical protein
MSKEDSGFHGEPCGRPSVDCWVGASGRTWWLCAEHWDVHVHTLQWCVDTLRTFSELALHGYS